MTPDMLRHAEARWNAWHEGRKIAMIGLIAIGALALIVSAIS